MTATMNTPTKVTEAELHAFVDGQLAESRVLAVEAHLRSHPADAMRVETWKLQNQGIRALFHAVAEEPPPLRLMNAAQRRTPTSWVGWSLAAGMVIGLLGGTGGWLLRGEAMRSEAMRGEAMRAPETYAGRPAGSSMRVHAEESLPRFAAVAHAVYAPDQKRPVEVSGEHEDQLVAWLSKRLGEPVRPPKLDALGYTLEGGRLLPGDQGPVAQFMYQDLDGARVTLYVTRQSAGKQVPEPGVRAKAPDPAAAFRFAKEGDVNVFYWIDGAFGYALSSQASRSDLARISSEVFRQLNPGG